MVESPIPNVNPLVVHGIDVFSLLTAIQDQNHERVNELLQVIPIETVVNDIGMTVFNYVCANCDDWKIIEAVIKRGPYINTMDSAGRTPLHNAARKLVNNHTHRLHQY